MSKCRHCNGNGMGMTAYGPKPCPFCNGTGEVDNTPSPRNSERSWLGKCWWLIALMGIQVAYFSHGAPKDEAAIVMIVSFILVAIGIKG